MAFFSQNAANVSLLFVHLRQTMIRIMTRLSVNINKIATLRNARGGDVPNVVKVALDCESFGAEGITVHPRPDERHIRQRDVYDLRPLLRTEFNIEGYPAPEFIDLVLKVKPHQVTLVPDSPTQLTSNAGWDTKQNLEFLTEVLETFNDAGIRTSVFVSADAEMIEYAAKAGADYEARYRNDCHKKNYERHASYYINYRTEHCIHRAVWADAVRRGYVEHNAHRQTQQIGCGGGRNGHIQRFRYALKH